MTTRIALAMFLVGLIAASGIAQEGAIDPNTLRKQILDSWTSLEATIRTCRMENTHEFFVARDGPLRIKTLQHYRWVVAPDHRLLFESQNRSEDDARPRSTEQTISNDRYEAVINKGKADGAWRLKSHKEGPHPWSAASRRVVLLPWTHLLDRDLYEWLADRRVKPIRAERLGQSAVRLHFTREPGGDPAGETIRSGYFDFDESRYYCIVGLKIFRKTAHSEGVMTCTCEYLPGGEFPRLQKAVMESPEIKSKKNGTYGVRSVDSYEVDYNFDPPEDEFWLSHYGLPEPVGVVREKRVPRYVWWLIAAGGFLILTLGFRYLARRRGTAKAQGGLA